MIHLPASRGHDNAGVSLEIRWLSRAELPAATALLGQGMVDNPLNVAAFGVDPERRYRRLRWFFAPLLRHVHAHGGVLGAFINSELAGVLGMLEPGCCRPAWPGKLGMVGAILGSNTPAGAWRIRCWLVAWMRRDPSEAHWHLGPLVVSAACRRRGVARQLMAHACRRLDRLDAVAWLETDLAINVAFYETLGFMVMAREPVLGVPNWFMRRVASAKSVPGTESRMGASHRDDPA